VVSVRSYQSSTASTFRSSSLWSSPSTPNNLIKKRRRRRLMAMHNRVSDELLFRQSKHRNRSQHSIINSSVLIGPGLTTIQSVDETDETEATANTENKLNNQPEDISSKEGQLEGELVITSDEDRAEETAKQTENKESEAKKADLELNDRDFSEMQVDENENNSSVSMSSNNSQRTRTNSEAASSTTSDLSELDEAENGVNNCKSLLFAPKNYLIQYSHHRQHLRNRKNSNKAGSLSQKTVRNSSTSKKSVSRKNYDNENDDSDEDTRAASNSSDSDATSDIEDEVAGPRLKQRKSNRGVEAAKAARHRAEIKQIFSPRKSLLSKKSASMFGGASSERASLIKRMFGHGDSPAAPPSTPNPTATASLANVRRVSISESPVSGNKTSRLSILPNHQRALDKIIRLGDKSSISSSLNEQSSDEDETRISPNVTPSKRNDLHSSGAGGLNSSRGNRRRLVLYDPKSYNVEKAFASNSSTSLPTNENFVGRFSTQKPTETISTIVKLNALNENPPLMDETHQVNVNKDSTDKEIETVDQTVNITNDTTNSSSNNRTESSSAASSESCLINASDSNNMTEGVNGVSTDKSIACGQMPPQLTEQTRAVSMRDSNSLSLFADEASIAALQQNQENHSIGNNYAVSSLVHLNYLYYA
jgi:hypothetical protein